MCRAGILVLLAFRCCLAQEFTFAVIADIQYADAPAAGARNYRGSLVKLEQAVAAINASKPAFTIQLGDLIDRNPADLDRILPVFNRIEGPRYHVIGNHDLCLDRATLVERLGMPAPYYSFTYRGWRFVVLDGMDDRSPKLLAQLKAAGRKNAFDWNGAAGAAQLRWLERELRAAEAAGERVVVFSHFPVLETASTAQHLLWNSGEVLRVLEASPAVAAHINGHDHRGGYASQNGIQHITVRGMVEAGGFELISVQNRSLRAAQQTTPGWRHLLLEGNGGAQQTGSAVFDIDGDRVADFAIMERTAAPAAVWYRKYQRYVIEPAQLRIEAGATFGDVDRDGDFDLIAGGDAGSNEVWWWENPHPNHDPAAGWRRHTVKASGGRKHHDLMWGDFDADGRAELVFWNQGGRRLVLARPPQDSKASGEWPLVTIHEYSADSEMKQRATAPAFKGVNEHEGLAAADIDGDGRTDIVGGALWFKHLGGDRFQPNSIDAGYHFSRTAAGQLIAGGRPEVVLVVGDGVGPLVLYEWVKGTWMPRELIAKVDNGHSLALADFNADGHLDIFCAEMRLNGGNPGSRTWILFGDGAGNFTTTEVARGFDNHESKVADLDGDGDLDILGKPYNYGVPGLNLWLRQ